MSQQKAAVVCENVNKSFSKREVILNELTLRIPQHKIFGLLGASGCGKTTLLNCIIGKTKVDDGLLQVFGQDDVDQSQIGYMPQSIGLSGILSVGETMWLFGRLTGMNSLQVKGRTEFLLTLLAMNKRLHSPINKLSGGEQRRVSFAVALLNEAPLLILDEPTVGVDSELRQNIWEYLRVLVGSTGKTVIITTHYIEEAKNSDYVGFMSAGKIIAFAAPTAIKEEYQCATLEDVFLRLCLNHNNSRNTSSSCEMQKIEFSQTKQSQKWKTAKRKCSGLFNWNNFLILIYMWHLKTLHLPGMVLFQLIYPMLVLPLLPLVQSVKPQKAPVGVVNLDQGQLGAAFFRNMAPDVYSQIAFDNYEEALKAAADGQTMAIVLLHQNFTNSIYSRLKNPFLIDGNISLQASVNVYIEPNFKSIDDGFQWFFINYQKKFMQNLTDNVTFANDLLQNTYDLSGRTNKVTSSFVAAGIFICSAQILFSTIAAVLIVYNRQDGFFDRLHFAGVTKTELMKSLILHHSSLLALFIMVEMFSAFVMVGLNCKGSYWLVFLLTFSHGISALYTGISIASISVNSYMAAVLIDVAVTISVFLQGLYEPIEYNSGFSALYLWGPAAYPIIALRGILHHAWTFTHPTVLTAFGINAAWVLVPLVISIATFRFSE